MLRTALDVPFLECEAVRFVLYCINEPLLCPVIESLGGNGLGLALPTPGRRISQSDESA